MTNMVILPKAIYKFNVIANKNPMEFSTERKRNLKIHKTTKDSE